MSFIICEMSTFEGLMDVDNEPGNRNSSRNLSATKMGIINAVHSRWNRQDDKGNSRNSIVNRIVKEGGTIPPDEILYISPKLTEREIQIDFIFEQLGKYDALNLYLEFTQYAAFIEMSSNQYGNEVPDFVPNHLDEDDEPITWVDWRDRTHNHIEVNGTFYVPTNSHNNGQDLAGSVLVMLENSTPSYNVRPMSQYPSGE